MAGVSLLLFTGCSTPQTRAREKPAALRQLSPADQKLALAGRIHEGFSKDVVYIAWGAPNRVYAGSAHHQPFDSWFYTRTEYGVAGGYFGVSNGFYYPGGYGGYGYGGYYGGRHHRGRYYGGPDDFYAGAPYIRGFPPPETEVPYKKAVFEHDRVISYETLQGESASAGAQAGF